MNHTVRIMEKCIRKSKISNQEKFDKFNGRMEEMKKKYPELGLFIESECLHHYLKLLVYLSFHAVSVTLKQFITLTAPDASSGCYQCYNECKHTELTLMILVEDVRIVFECEFKSFLLTE